MIFRRLWANFGARAIYSVQGRLACPSRKPVWYFTLGENEKATSKSGREAISNKASSFGEGRGITWVLSLVRLYGRGLSFSVNALRLRLAALRRQWPLS